MQLGSTQLLSQQIQPLTRGNVTVPVNHFHSDFNHHRSSLIQAWDPSKYNTSIRLTSTCSILYNIFHFICIYDLNRIYHIFEALIRQLNRKHSLILCYSIKYHNIIQDLSLAPSISIFSSS